MYTPELGLLLKIKSCVFGYWKSLQLSSPDFPHSKLKIFVFFISNGCVRYFRMFIVVICLAIFCFGGHVP